MDWLKKGPPLEDLISGSKDERKGKRPRAALIIPTYKSNDQLLKHISALAAQQKKEFDIITVCGKDDEYITCPGWASILQVREKGKHGSAGAFYIGELAAFAEGYEEIVLADCDLVPQSPDLMGKLLDFDENPFRIPRLVYGRDKPIDGLIIHHYGAMKKEVFDKVGVTYFPFYSGGEDLELMERILQRGFRPRVVDAIVWHPKRVPLALSPGYDLYNYQRGILEYLIMRGKLLAAWRFCIFNLSHAAVYFLAGRAANADIFFRAVWRGSGMSMFSESDAPANVLPPQAGNPAAEIFDSENPVPGRRIGQGSALDWILQRTGFLWDYLLSLHRYTGSVLLRGSSRWTDLPVLLLAGSAYLENEGTKYVLFQERGKIIRAAGAFAALLALPFIFAFAAFLVLRGMILARVHGIEAVGYGPQGLKPH
jgi:GT2 family glycosyltransferase